MKHLFLLVVAVLVVSATSFGQQSSDIQYDANVASAGGPLTVAVSGTPLYDLLRPGVSYKAIADNVVNVTNITPVDPNNPEAFTPGVIDLTGAPGAQVAVSFVMPAALASTNGIGTITMTYDNQSASVVDIPSGLPSQFFNPQNGRTVTIDASGVAQLLIGGNPAVSANAVDGEVFQGFGLVTVEYTGL